MQVRAGSLHRNGLVDEGNGCGWIGDEKRRVEVEVRMKGVNDERGGAQARAEMMNMDKAKARLEA